MLKLREQRKNGGAWKSLPSGDIQSNDITAHRERETERERRKEIEGADKRRSGGAMRHGRREMLISKERESCGEG